VPQAPHTGGNNKSSALFAQLWASGNLAANVVDRKMNPYDKSGQAESTDQ
jgi:hypothetical protein